MASSGNRPAAALSETDMAAHATHVGSKILTHARSKGERARSNQCSGAVG